MQERPSSWTDHFQATLHSTRAPLGARADFALPEREHVPASRAEGTRFRAISGAVPRELRAPPLGVGLRQRQSTVRAAVPETAVDEHHKPLSPEDEIGATWNPAGRDSVAPNAGAEQRLPQRKLRARVGCSVRAHHPRGALAGGRRCPAVAQVGSAAETFGRCVPGDSPQVGGHGAPRQVGRRTPD